jgi:hypothetical protein
MAKLPTVSSDIPRDLRQFVERVREALNGTGQDEIVTVRKLVAAGIASYSNGGVSVPVNNNYSYPPAPSGVEASGALANIIVTWGKPIYAGHAYAEIYAAEELEDGSAPVIGDAELIGMAPGTVFVHNLGAAATRWYWVRFVNIAGEAGPYNATDGIEASTGQDAGYLLEVLTGEITQDQLYSELSTRVDRIDTKTRVFRQETEPFYAVNPDGTLQTGSEAYALVDGDIWINTSVTYYDDYTTGDYVIRANRMNRWDADAEEWVDFMDFGFQDWFTAINTEKTERIAEDGALAERVNTLETAGYVDSGFVAASISNTDIVSTSELNGAIALSRSEIEAIYDGKDLTTRGLITDEAETRAGETSALAQRLNTIEADYVTDVALSSAITNADTVSATELNAVATSVTTLQATLTDPGGPIDVAKGEAINAATTAAAIDAAALVQLETDARISADGEITSKYSVKLDSAGHVSGFGLLSTGNAYDNSIHSEFGVTADTFFVAPPVYVSSVTPANPYRGMVWRNTVNDTVKYYDGYNWGTEPENFPFIVRTSPTAINGVSVPAGVYIQDAYIANGTITNAKIGNAAIDDAKIASLDAGKITTGYLDAGRIAANSITADLINTNGLTIRDANGNVILTSGSTLAVPTSVNFTGGEEIFNGAHKFVDINGRPAGLKTAASSTFSEAAEDGTYASVSYIDVEKGIIEFRPHATLDIPANNTAYSKYLLYPAFKVNPNTEYEFTYRYKVSGGSSASNYSIGVWSTTGDLEEGNTCLRELTSSTVYETGVQDASTYDMHVNNSQTNHTTWVTQTFNWTPDAGTKWASVQFRALRSIVFEIDVVSVVSKATVGAEFGVNISGQITSTNVSTYIADAAIGNAQIQNATIDVAKIDTATIDDLNSFTANIGTVTAGKMESTDGKMVVDLDNKFIKIEV